MTVRHPLVYVPGLLEFAVPGLDPQGRAGDVASLRKATARLIRFLKAAEPRGLGYSDTGSSPTLLVYRWDPRKTVAAEAKRLSTAVKSFAGDRKVVLLGAELGTLICRWYTDRFAGGQVARQILLSPADQGLPMALDALLTGRPGAAAPAGPGLDALGDARWQRVASWLGNDPERLRDIPAFYAALPTERIATERTSAAGFDHWAGQWLKALDPADPRKRAKEARWSRSLRAARALTRRLRQAPAAPTTWVYGVAQHTLAGLFLGPGHTVEHRCWAPGDGLVPVDPGRCADPERGLEVVWTGARSGPAGGRTRARTTTMYDDRDVFAVIRDRTAVAATIYARIGTWRGSDADERALVARSQDYVRRLLRGLQAHARRSGWTARARTLPLARRVFGSGPTLPRDALGIVEPAVPGSVHVLMGRTGPWDEEDALFSAVLERTHQWYRLPLRARFDRPGDGPSRTTLVRAIAAATPPPSDSSGTLRLNIDWSALARRFNTDALRTVTIDPRATPLRATPTQPVLTRSALRGLRGLGTRRPPTGPLAPVNPTRPPGRGSSDAPAQLVNGHDTAALEFALARVPTLVFVDRLDTLAAREDREAFVKQLQRDHPLATFVIRDPGHAYTGELKKLGDAHAFTELPQRLFVTAALIDGPALDVRIIPGPVDTRTVPTGPARTAALEVAWAVDPETGAVIPGQQLRLAITGRGLLPHADDREIDFEFVDERRGWTRVVPLTSTGGTHATITATLSVGDAPPSRLELHQRAALAPPELPADGSAVLLSEDQLARVLHAVLDLAAWEGRSPAEAVDELVGELGAEAQDRSDDWIADLVKLLVALNTPDVAGGEGPPTALVEWLLAREGEAIGTPAVAVFSAALEALGVLTVVPGVEDDIRRLNEAQVGDWDLVDIGFLERATAAAAAVVRVVAHVPSGDETKPSNGTGWLVAPGLVLTAWHVLVPKPGEYGPDGPTDADIDALVAGLEVFVGFDAEGLDVDPIGVRAVRFKDTTLDVALLELPDPLDAPGLDVLGDRFELPDMPPRVNIIQHPSGLPKQMALRDNVLTSVVESDGVRMLHYFADTLGGSSGAPVMDDAMRVIGMHRSSTTTRVPGVRFATKINLGVAASDIVAAVVKADPMLAAELGWSGPD